MHHLYRLVTNSVTFAVIPENTAISVATINQPEFLTPPQFFYRRLTLLRGAPIGNLGGPQQQDRPTAPRIFRTANTLSIVLQQSSLQVSGNSGVKRRIGTLQNVDMPGVFHHVRQTP